MNDTQHSETERYETANRAIQTGATSSSRSTVIDQSESSSGTTRRAFLAGITTAGVAGLAGCTGGGGDDESEGTPTAVETIPPELQLDGRSLASSFPLKLDEIESGQTMAEVQWHERGSHWHFQPLEIPSDSWLELRVRFLDPDQDVIPVGENESYQARVRRTADTSADLLGVVVSNDIISLRGKSPGTGQLLVDLMDGDTALWTTPPLNVTVPESESVFA